MFVNVVCIVLVAGRLVRTCVYRTVCIGINSGIFNVIRSAVDRQRRVDVHGIDGIFVG